MKQPPMSQQVFAEQRLAEAVRKELDAKRFPRTAGRLLVIALLGLAATGTVQAEFSAAVELSELDGSNGFAVNGPRSGADSGTSVSGAGDVNSDGIDDFIIGTRSDESSYVVFGRRGVGSGLLDLSALDGANGFAINGISLGCRPVSGAGDVNGDGVDDVIIGAAYASPNGGFSGQAYVVFGRQGVGSSGVLELSSLDGSNGFVLNGISAEDSSGYSVSGAGDVNGDGIDDLIIGAPQTYLYDSPGRTYVVFGKPTIGRGGVLELSALNGRNGFTLNGINPVDRSGRSVSGAGDVNDDGIDDLIIGGAREPA